jgi:hypothetical protein
VTTEVLSYSISAGATVRAPRGRLFYVKSAPNGGLTISASGRPGAPIRFTNVSAGLRYGIVAEKDVWEYLEITSATAQTVEMIIGDDDVEIAGTVSVAGTVATREAPGVPSVATDSTLAANGTGSLGANLTAKQTFIGNTAASVGNVRVAFNNTATASLGWEIQPGTGMWFDTNQGFSVFAAGGSITWYYGYIV